MPTTKNESANHSVVQLRLLSVVAIVPSFRHPVADYAFSFCPLIQTPFTLGCGQPIFQRISAAFELHDTSEETIVNNNGVFARYYSTGPNGSKALKAFGKLLVTKDVPLSLMIWL